MIHNELIKMIINLCSVLFYPRNRERDWPSIGKTLALSLISGNGNGLP